MRSSVGPPACVSSCTATAANSTSVAARPRRAARSHQAPAGDRGAPREAPRETMFRVSAGGARFWSRSSLCESSPMSEAPDIEVRRLDAAELRARLDGLAAVLHDCVAGGASVSYLAPFSLEQARSAFEEFVADAERGRRLILGAFAGGELVGTVQVVLALPPNQPHRAEVAKLLVRRSARRRGIAEQLMAQAEREARAVGKTLLVLDTVTGSAAERLYERLGFTPIGVIPGFALYPDGRPCDATVFWKAL